MFKIKDKVKFKSGAKIPLGASPANVYEVARVDSATLSNGKKRHWVHIIDSRGNVFKVNFLNLEKAAVGGPIGRAASPSQVQKKECTCEMSDLMRDGCRCGAINKYKPNKVIT